MDGSWPCLALPLKIRTKNRELGRCHREIHVTAHEKAEGPALHVDPPASMSPQRPAGSPGDKCETDHDSWPSRNPSASPICALRPKDRLHIPIKQRTIAILARSSPWRNRVEGRMSKEQARQAVVSEYDSWAKKHPNEASHDGRLSLLSILTDRQVG